MTAARRCGRKRERTRLRLQRRPEAGAPAPAAPGSPPAAAPLRESVWGFPVDASHCSCLRTVDDGIAWADEARATYAACDVPAHPDADAVEDCFDRAHPGTTVAGSTDESGTVTTSAAPVDPCERIEWRATRVHETFHSRSAERYARDIGGAFYAEWQRRAGTPNRLDAMEAAFPKEVALYRDRFYDGHEWAADEVNSYTWERRFLMDVRRALRRICP